MEERTKTFLGGAHTRPKIDREYGEGDHEHDAVNKSLVEVITHLHRDAEQDCQCAVDAKIHHFRHEVTADDQLLEKWIQANKRNRESGDPEPEKSMQGLGRQIMAGIEVVGKLEGNP
jgi:hypothetical protein